MSEKDRSELEPLFAPPPGAHGTHLLLCGLSADTETLERVLAAFTNEAPAQRRASGLVRGWLLLDASTPIIAAQPVPGLMRLAPCVKEIWKARTTLLHAKVALMGFGPSRCAVPSRWRLVVSTGNWTASTWGSQGQIDLFWTTDWDAQADSATEDAAQSLADVHAALKFFEQVLEGLHGHHYNMLRDDALAAGWLKVWRERLRLRGHARKCEPRFIQSLKAPLLGQIGKRFPADGVSTLVAGSGFFEQGVNSTEKVPAVLQALEALGRPAMKRHLVFNPSQAGALATWFAKLREAPRERRKLNESQAGKWTLRFPRDPLLKSARGGRTFLHAKYIAGLRTVRDNDTARLIFLYLGSGNLSRRGVLSRAHLDAPAGARRRDVGNIEAGVVALFDERVERIWQRLACGEAATPALIAAAVPGGGEEMFEPLDPPPLLFLREGAEGLALARSALPAASLWLQEADGHWTHVAAEHETVRWTSACPSFVRARAANPASVADAPEWEVPVLSRDGFFCRGALPQLRVDDVLHALLAFPNTPPHDDDNDDDDGINRGAGGGRVTTVSPYPLRTLAALVEVIGHRNSLVSVDEFPYWLAQLRLLMLEQAVAAERNAIRDLGVDLFGALRQPGFAPPWLVDHPLLRGQYGHLLHDLRSAWCLPQVGQE